MLTTITTIEIGFNVTHSLFFFALWGFNIFIFLHFFRSIILSRSVYSLPCIETCFVGRIFLPSISHRGIYLMGTFVEQRLKTILQSLIKISSPKLSEMQSGSRTKKQLKNEQVSCQKQKNKSYGKM